MNTFKGPINRWSALTFKSGLVTSNRIIVPPMASGTATTNGIPTQETIKHYERLSKSCAGIVMVEYTYIHESGRSEPNQTGLDSQDRIDFFKPIAQAIKSSGAIAGIQLVHGGGRSLAADQFPLMGPSPVSVPVKNQTLETPIAMSLAQIEDYKAWYVQAAIRANLAGFQIIELHAAHGYGLNQWLSPITNTRTDKYGGSIENRSKILFEILLEIKVLLPDTTLGVRLPGQDHFDGGLTQAEMIWVSKQLENLGLDFVDVSSGIGGWKRPEARLGEGYLVSDAAEIQKNISIPVIGVGGIESGDYIDKILSQGQVSLTAVGRKILKDPAVFHKNVLATNLQNFKNNISYSSTKNFCVSDFKRSIV